MNKPKLIGVAVAVELLGGAVVGDVVFVPDDYPTLQAAIFAAGDDPGDFWTIWVRPGTWAFTSIAQPVLIVSVEGADVTAISGGAVTIGTAEDGTTLKDFTFTGALRVNSSGAATIDGCVFTGDKEFEQLRLNATSSVTGCLFVGSAHGAIRIAGGGSGSGTITDCSFIGNSIAGDGSEGGAVWVTGRTTITDCYFEDNTAVLGGAIYWRNGTASDIPRITNCRFSGNTAVLGGAVYIEDTSPLITNCVLVGNEATFGGAIFIGAGYKTPKLVNTTIAGNVADIGGAIVMDDFVVLTILNSIIWFNGVDSVLGTPLSILDDVRFSNTENTGLCFPGNIHRDPQFVDLVNGDVHLEPGSPSIDGRGRSWVVPIDSIDLDGDGDTTELLPLDLDGNPRFSDAPALNDGCGTAIVDMGAYEFPGTPIPCLRFGDVNEDAVVNVLDLIDLLLSFGATCVPTEFECCPADFDLSGTVDVLDLIDLLLAFGTACP